MIRLLHKGLPLEGCHSSYSANPFSPEELTTSPLCPQGAKVDMFRPLHNSPLPCLELTEPADTISHFWAPGENSRPIYLAGTCTSSLDAARALANAGMFPVWGSLIVLNQTAGRGQLGHTWKSPVGNLYVSLRLPLEGPFVGTSAAPALGALLVRAFNLLGYPVFMKWPNDLVFCRTKGSSNWHKTGGILLEERPVFPAHAGKKRENMLVAGIGINLVSSPSATEMRRGHAMPAGCLPSVPDKAEAPLSLVDLWTQLVNRVFSCYVEAELAKNSQKWLDFVTDKLAFAGEMVLLEDGCSDQECHTGFLLGLDESGGIRLLCQNKVCVFHSGSLRTI